MDTLRNIVESNTDDIRMTLEDESDKEVDSTLSYIIHKYSSYSTNYFPSNIYKDDPSDQTSRWSSDSSEFPQFLILKLKRPSIVKFITFGKYEKAHVCNIKKFCIYGGLTEDNMILLLESGLKNNSASETFNLRFTVGKNKFPIRFLKIMPLQTWGSTFNFSIWHVSLKGCSDWNVVQNYINSYSLYKEKEAIRLCLKHLREQNYTEAFESLLRQSKVRLEDPFLTEIYNQLVKNGNYEICEELVRKAYEDGNFQNYISKQQYKPKWSQIVMNSALKEAPGMRGGHQMCIDSSTQTIYLFGGWDGMQDLSDLWSFNVALQEWTCISRDTQQEGGPCGRSCHKMCLDPKRRQIFTLGRFVDPSMRTEDNIKSDFYMYDIESNSWTMISEDTSTVGGPFLVFDHQLVMDIECRIIYVFGGRIVTATEDALTTGNREHKYSGLYSYHVATSTWTKLRDDGTYNSSTKIKARIGHSMLFHNIRRQLFILGGQRHKEFLTDFFVYNIDPDSITMISDGARKEPGSMPSPGFTQKATIDVTMNEIHILAGLSKEKNRKLENVRNSFWIYSISPNKWTCVYHNDLVTDGNNSKKLQPLEPCPRYAYQLVYDESKKVHFLFGGNPGNLSDPSLRLDDFWSFFLYRPTEDQLLHNSIFLLRKSKYKELAFTEPLTALTYLQRSLYESVDHQNPEQVKEFQSLASTLFQSPSGPPSPFGSLAESESSLEGDAGLAPGPCSPAATGDDFGENFNSSSLSEGEKVNLSMKEIQQIMQKERLKVFQQISLYMPEDMAQPKANLLDFIPY